MKTPLRLLLLPVLLLFALVALPGALHAQLPKIFVASTGNDANDGSRGSPKRNFQAAHNAVAADGEIVALDTAGYGALAITKGVTITVPAGITGLITVSGGTAVSVAAGASDTISLRGLTIERIGGSGGSGGDGINCTSVGTLEVSDCVVQGFGVSSNRGLTFAPGASATLVVNRCTMRTCYAGGSVFAPPSGTANATFVDCQFLSSTFGLSVQGGTGAGSFARVAARNCTASGCGDGFIATFNTRTVLQNCTASGNSGSGVSASAPGSGQTAVVTLLTCSLCNNATGVQAADNTTVRVDGCAVTNHTSFGFNQTGTGSILSRGNNTLASNTNNSAFGTYTAQ